MATLVLQAAGAFAGNLVGGPFGAMIGQAAGAMAGGVIDQKLFGSGGRNSSGPRLTRLPGLTATEGGAIARVYGRGRTGGTLIWMTRFEESINVTRAGGSGGKSASPRVSNYTYAGNFAIGVCEGRIAGIRRIWADGVELDQTKYTIRIYQGTETQTADPLIVAKEGAQNTPAYRGLAYAVFERMPLEPFGNRIPQLSFEVIKPVAGVNDLVQGICIIPGSSEFAYQPAAVTSTLSAGISSSENRHVLTRSSDWEASIDALQSLCANVKSSALVVSWFGDDLRAGSCTITPRTEKTAKALDGFSWSVAGLTRAMAQQVSEFSGKPAYGGTPSDGSVIAAIQDLNARGLNVVFYPFVMMDIPDGNILQDPWTGEAFQPSYPWRGRITCMPAPGQTGTPDGTAAAVSQVASFFGGASPPQTEWSYRRFILHYANLCVAAGGVDAFLIGSELKGLTRVRSASGIYPAVTALAELAADVKLIVGPHTKVSYAADWTEYGAHVLEGGSEVRFPLDTLWASPSIDFIGIDAYWPLADWREGHAHSDLQESDSIYDLEYLRKGMNGGEAYDWYYANDQARMAQDRTAITDGAYAKPWCFRQKDICGWWSNAHYERTGSVELATPSPWAPASKPVWFTETGCPAVDRGANAPNVFPDLKSSESRTPWFSRGFRDDLMQQRAIEAFLTFFESIEENNNPVSPVYGGRMVDCARIHLWAWDARPFPAFPQQGQVWADSDAWHTGHWLNGRLEAPALDILVRQLALEVSALAGSVPRPRIDAILDGYIIEQSVSPRHAIEPLSAFFGFDAVISSGHIAFQSRGKTQMTAISGESIMARKNGGLIELSRAQESELSRSLTINFYDGEIDYRTAAVTANHIDGVSNRDSVMDIAIVTSRAEAQRRADIMLQDMWTARESVEFELPNSAIALEVADHVSLSVDGGLRRFRINRIVDGRSREISASAVEPAIFEHAPPMLSPAATIAPLIPGKARVEFLDLALVKSAPAVLQYAAVFADPWPGRMAIWRRVGDSSFEFLRYVDQPAIIGETLNIFESGPVGRIDRGARLTVKIPYGAFSSADMVAALSGRNGMAIREPGGGWQIFCFLTAELIGEGLWRLSNFIRGLGGAGHLANEDVPAGAVVVLLDNAVVPLTADLSELGQTHFYKTGPADRDYADDSYIDAMAAVTNTALMPYAPVRPKCRRTGEGVEISFLRRGREGADAWDPVNIPLSEESESYEIDILAAGVLLRTLSGAATSILYSQSQELTDFGALQIQLELSLYQISAVTGRGFPARMIVNII